MFTLARMRGFISDWNITIFGISTVATVGGISLYKLKHDPVNNHPVVLGAVNQIVTSGVFRAEDIHKDWPVMGKVNDNGRAKLSFPLVTPQGNGKVQVSAHLTTTPSNEIQWITDSLVIDFLDSKDRYVFDTRLQKWYKETTPVGAIQLTDLVMATPKKMVGPAFEYVKGSVFEHPYRWAVVVALAGLGFRFRRTFLPDPLFGHVRRQLDTNPVLMQFLGDPVKVAYKLDGTIDANIANFALDVSGPEAKGKVHVQAYKQDGKWKVSLAKFKQEGSSKSHMIKVT